MKLLILIRKSLIFLRLYKIYPQDRVITEVWSAKGNCRYTTNLVFPGYLNEGNVGHPSRTVMFYGKVGLAETRQEA